MRVTTACLTLLLAIGPASLVGQTYAVDRGVWKIGGTARVSRYHDIGSDQGVFIADVNPQLGFFVRPGLALTANVRVSRYGYDTGHTWSYGLGPGITYYLGHDARRFHPFLSARTLYTKSTTYLDSGPSGSYSNFNWLASAGGMYLAASNVGITGELFYSHTHNDFGGGGSPQGSSNEEYGTQFGVSVFLF
jgi:hypothetical protein